MKRPVKAFLIVLLLFAPPVLAQEAYVYVQGEVRTPGAIKYTNGMTLSQAIALAGGFTTQGSPRHTYLTRGQVTRRFNLNSHPVYPVIDAELRPGDIIDVRERLF